MRKRNITHLQITSNHNWVKLINSRIEKYNTPSNYVKSQPIAEALVYLAQI